jgi:hypothetical protein
LTVAIAKYEPLDGPSPFAPLYQTIIGKSLHAMDATGLPFVRDQELENTFRAADMLGEYEDRLGQMR